MRKIIILMIFKNHNFEAISKAQPDQRDHELSHCIFILSTNAFCYLLEIPLKVLQSAYHL